MRVPMPLISTATLGSKPIRIGARMVEPNMADNVLNAERDRLGRRQGFIRRDDAGCFYLPLENNSWKGAFNKWRKKSLRHFNHLDGRFISANHSKA